MDPIFKWTGGKRKEIKIFGNYYPEFVKNKKDYTYIEPFFGGGAVYWDLENSKNIINDVDFDLINFLKVVKINHKELSDMIEEIELKIDEITNKEKNDEIDYKEAKILRGEFYYYWRNKDRKNGLNKLSRLDRAFRFYFVTQWAFNGMRRFNSSGEFNIPYGNYKTFKKSFNDKHIDLLINTEIFNGDYKKIMLDNDKDDVFIYLDPPYTRDFKEYSHGNVFDDESQVELSNTFKSIKNGKVMLIINKDDFTTSLYKNYIKHEYDLKYATNIKNRYSNVVKHLIITNY